MKALSKGTPVRLRVKEVEGVILRTETNEDEFGYRVKWIDEDGLEQERFFKAEDIEAVTPIGSSLSLSLSGIKDDCVEQAYKATTNSAMRRAVVEFLYALPGTHFSGSLSINVSPDAKSAPTISVTGSTWTEEEKEEVK